ncbi:MAG: rhomboid family intramembrane serine protease [Crenarchaeota archaeon]|nr:rhomboid family intramembrane serine protease [Thermoproteota archaeon]
MVFWYEHGLEPYRFNPIVVKSIIISNLAIFVLELINPALMINYFALRPNAVLRGATLWTIITHMFLHADFLHIFFNMYALYMFGPECERNFGHKAFALLYFLSGLLGAFMHILLCPYKDIPALGASGAVFGILGAYAVLYPQRRIAMFVFFAFLVLPAWAMITMLVALFTLFAIVGIFPTIAHYAHIGGIIGGILFAIVFRSKFMRRMLGYKTAIVYTIVEHGYNESEDYSDYEYY